MRLRRRPVPRRPSESMIAFGTIAASALLAGRFFPFHLIPSVCGLRNATGLPCPTCGMTRAFVRLTHGDWHGAWHVNPLGSVLCVASAVFVVWVALRLTVLKRGLVFAASPREKRIAAIALAVLLGVNWIYLLVSKAATS